MPFLTIGDDVLFLVQGVYYYSDGSVYDGVWVAGKMQGKGSFLYPNGNKYDGDFFVSIYCSIIVFFFPPVLVVSVCYE